VHYNVISRLPCLLTRKPLMRHFTCAVILALIPTLAAAQEKTVVPPEKIATPPQNVKIEGMPPMPQSVLDGLSRYGQFRQALLQAWHPTKRQMVITTTLGTVAQLHYLDGPGRDRRQLTWYANGVSRDLVSPSFDPTDPGAFVFQYSPEGTEARALYRFDLATGGISLLVDSKTRFPHIWSRQGKWLAFDSSERNGKDRDLYIIQPSDPKSKRLLAQVDGTWSPEDWSPDGSMILMTEVFGNSENYLWRVDVKTGEKTPITKRGDGDKTIWYNARFSNDGKKVYAVSDRGGNGQTRIWRCNVAKCAWTPVTADGLVIDVDWGFEISPDGSMLATILDRGTSTELHLVDLTTLKTRLLPAIPRGIVTRLHWRPGSRELGFTFGSVKAQGDVYSVDTSLGTLARWTFSETTFNPDVLPIPEVIEWKSFDGQTISGVLYRPAMKFTGPRPVMIQIHGGPDFRERAQFRGRSNYLLNELGVAIIYPNVRGSIGFGRAFQDLDNGRGRDGAIKDIGALLDWVGGHPELDKDRIVLNGVSYGGWLALEAGIVYNDRIRGVIEGAGITDFVTFLEQTEAARQDNRRLEYGDERDPQMREYLKSISPITRASELRKPTLMIQAGKDTRVPVDQGRQLMQAMQASKTPVWYLEYPEANHDNLGQIGGDYLLASWMWFFKNFVLN
jgi:dipeptidyl aminopeptidase/acylaminoacyl peptidase